MRFGRLKRVLGTILLRLRGRSDHRRWSALENISPEWESRSEMLAAMVPRDSRVLEFGAGRMILRKYLPPGCVYTPSDLVDRGMGTIVCDLNAKSLPEFPDQDVVVFSGVLEYVNDVPRLIAHIGRYCRLVLASYAVSHGGSLREMIKRREATWVNDYTSDDLVEIFRQSGFECLEERDWNEQKVFCFSSSGDVSGADLPAGPDGGRDRPGN